MSFLSEFAADAINAMAHRSGAKVELSASAALMSRKPIWAIAGEALALAGRTVDMYGDRESICAAAMEMGADSTRRVQFFSENEDARYINASAPSASPGDFPNILSGIANKYLDSIELDGEFSYAEISAVLPEPLKDFKPAIMINRSSVDELDEVTDGERFQDLGLAEEVLSYLFLRRFGNRFGWTPVLMANDDMGAFAEGMLGLNEAWQVTQNRLVLDRLTSEETLLDGNPLFANRPDSGTGAIPATNNNLRASGLAPSDAEWGQMQTLYGGIAGIGTGRRVSGTLNTILVPTAGAVYQAALRTFATYPTIGESKVGQTTADLGIYRNQVRVVAESELSSIDVTSYYGFRKPTDVRTATIVRAYFAGYGSQGRRERWYDPETKTTYVSLEGRIAVATKNWRYAVRNAGIGG